MAGELTVYYCQEDATALCLIDQVRLVVPATVEAEGAGAVQLDYQPPPLKAP